MAGPWEKYQSGAPSAGPWAKYAASAAPRGRTFITEAQPWEDTRSPAEQAVGSRDQGVAQGYAPSTDSGGGLLGDWGVPGFADARQRAAYVERQNRNAPGRLATAVQGPTLGFGDEILGAGAGLVSMAGGGTFNEGYQPVRDAIRSNADGYAAENPASALGVSVVSAAPTAMALTPRALLEAPALTARLAGGAGVGAGLGAVAGFGEGEGGFDNRMASAGAGSVVGAGFGVAGELLGAALGPVVRRILGTRTRVLDSAGNVTPEAAQIAREAGVDLSQAPPELLARMQAVLSRGGGEGVAGTANAIMAESLPVPVPLSRGQAVNDVAMLAKESALARGALGNPAMNIMRDFRERQMEALRANIPAIRERMAAGSPIIERGQAGPIVSGALNDANKAGRQSVNALYRDARELDAVNAPGRVPFAPVDEAAGSMAAPVEGYISDATAAVRNAREPMPGEGLPGIINTIQRNGGIKLTDAQGRLTSEGGDVRAIFDKGVPPGLVNNKSGRPLDYWREKLIEDGWFVGRNPDEVTTADVLDLLSSRARDPMSTGGGKAGARDIAERQRLRSDLEGMGVTRRTPEDTAAGRLALTNDARARGEADPTFGGAAPAGVRFADEGVSITGRVAEQVRSGHAPANVPKVWAEIEGLNREIQNRGLSPRALYETRQRLNGIRKGGGEDAVAAGTAINELDAAISDAVDNALLQGDEQAIAAFKAANAAYKQFADQFKRKDLVGLLVSYDFERGAVKVDPREATNAIFGTSDLGFINKRDIIRDLEKLRSVLGPDSEAWNAVRQEAWNRVAGQAWGTSGPNGREFSGANLAKGWEDATRKNPEVMRVLFSNEERRDIGNFVNVARRATTQDKAVYAPSTSPWAMRAMAALSNRIPVVGKWLAEGMNAARGAYAARDTTSGRLYDARNRRLIPLGRAVPGATETTLRLSGP